MSAANPALPLASTGRRAVEDALVGWLASTTGLGEDRCWWGNSAVVVRSFPFATMRWLSTTTMGTDSHAIENLYPIPEVSVPDIRLHATGMRRCTVSVQCFDDPGVAPEASPLLRLETAIARLALPDDRSALIAAGFGFVSATGVREVQPGQYVVELTGHITSAVAVDTYSIQTVEAVGVDDLAFIGGITLHVDRTYDDAAVTYDEATLSYDGA